MLKTSAQGKGKCYNLEEFYLHILKRVRISISDRIFPQMERLSRVRKHLGTRRKSRLSGSDSAIRRTTIERWGKFTAISIIPPYGYAVEWPLLRSFLFAKYNVFHSYSVERTLFISGDGISSLCQRRSLCYERIYIFMLLLCCNVIACVVVVLLMLFWRDKAQILTCYWAFATGWHRCLFLWSSTLFFPTPTMEWLPLIFWYPSYNKRPSSSSYGIVGFNVVIFETTLFDNWYSWSKKNLF